MADERLRSLEREGNSAHATCRAVGHAWVPVSLMSSGAQDPRGYYDVRAFRLNAKKARQCGFSPSASLWEFLAAWERARLNLDSLDRALLSRQRPRFCTRCNSLDQRWGPWRLEGGPLWPRSLVRQALLEQEARANFGPWTTT